MTSAETINKEYVRLEEELGENNPEIIPALVNVYGAESVSQWMISKAAGLLDKPKTKVEYGLTWD
jgi:hypothetical protein